MQITMPQPCHTAIAMLEQAGFEAYVVGGCVRDSLLGKTPNDWDICTSALPEEILAVFGRQRTIPTGIKHGTVTVLLSGMSIEVTTYRIDGQYTDHRRPETVSYTTSLQDDLSRRDFTINAMAWNTRSGLIDPFGGKTDLALRVVRAVGDPRQRFEEDGLRIMRLVRFATVLDFDYETDTVQAATEKVHLLRFISAERIQVELNKILMSVRVSRGLSDLNEYGMLPYIVPYMCHTVGFEQAGGHHFLDVFEHSLLSTALIEAELTLRLTMFLHDVGKPFVWQRHPSGAYDDFSDHESVGAELANQVLRALKYDNATRKEVVKLIRHHNDMITEDPLSIRRILRQLGEATVRRLIKVKVADILAHDVQNKRDSVVVLFANIEAALDAVLARGECVTIADLAVNGQDMMTLGISGKDIGVYLNALLDAVVEAPHLNTRSALLQLAETRHNQE